MTPVVKLPTTEPTPPAKDSSATASPWKTPTASSKDRTVEWPPIEWIHTGRRIIRCLEAAVSISPIATAGHSTETSSSTSHRTHSPGSSSIKSWHDYDSFPQCVSRKSCSRRLCDHPCRGPLPFRSGRERSVRFPPEGSQLCMLRWLLSRFLQDTDIL